MSRPAAVTIGVIALRSPWRKIDAPLGQPLRARGADVVLGHHLDHVRRAAGARRRRRSAAASTNHGMISDWNHSHGSCENGT